ncbi:uncharacterized protein LOC127840657 [Dreissena polymorpha]|uniref:uncharacterized protein LOC127840657 n=1 Tax=Dreissena polymorpha TaxID=45954 RepID=UPI002264BC01|nr:uncharacterized protein LOC127840657 [Dreissena polymorpha]
MKCYTFRIIIILSCLFSMGLQLAGLIAPAWMRFEYRPNENVSMEVSSGQWYHQVCLNLPNGQQCQALNNLGSIYGLDLSEMVSSFTVMKVLLMISVVLCVIGIVLVLLYFHREDAGHQRKVVAVIGSLIFGVSATVVMGIVAVQAFKHTAMAQAASKTVVLGPGGLTFGLQVNLPWALVVSGIGGAFSLITAIVIGVRVCCCSPVIGGESTRYTAHYVSDGKDDKA